MKTIYTAAIPASAHDLTESIADCACDSACYTDEVKNLSCRAARWFLRPKPAAALPIGRRLRQMALWPIVWPTNRP